MSLQIFKNRLKRKETWMWFRMFKSFIEYRMVNTILILKKKKKKIVKFIKHFLFSGTGCSLKSHCTNKQFQNKQFKRTQIVKTPDKGYGVFALEDIPR